MGSWELGRCHQVHSKEVYTLTANSQTVRYTPVIHPALHQRCTTQNRVHDALWYAHSSVAFRVSVSGSVICCIDGRCPRESPTLTLTASSYSDMRTVDISSQPSISDLIPMDLTFMSVSVDRTPGHLWVKSAQAMCRLMHPGLEFLHSCRQVQDSSCNPVGLREIVLLLRLSELGGRTKVLLDDFRCYQLCIDLPEDVNGWNTPIHLGFCAYFVLKHLTCLKH